MFTPHSGFATMYIQIVLFNITIIIIIICWAHKFSLWHSRILILLFSLNLDVLNQQQKNHSFHYIKTNGHKYRNLIYILQWNRKHKPYLIGHKWSYLLQELYLLRGNICDKIGEKKEDNWLPGQGLDTVHVKNELPGVLFFHYSMA